MSNKSRLPIIVPRKHKPTSEKDVSGEMQAFAKEIKDFDKIESCYYHQLSDKDGKDGKDQKVYAFDLDGTLIKTKSGKKFAENGDDWLFWHDNVFTKICDLLVSGSCILIITNQKGVGSGKTQISDISLKFNQIVNKFSSIPDYDKRFGIYVATDDDRYRKPWTGIWDLLSPIQNNIVCFCGDAAGRPQDHSAADQYFAHNIGKPFFTPEEFFLNDSSGHSIKPVPLAPYICQELMDSPDFSTTNYTKNLTLIVEDLKSRPKSICIMIGSPGSGKSSLSATIAKELGKSSVHIERDALGGVQKKFLSKITAEIQNPNIQWIIADATHPNHESRSDVINIAKHHGWTPFIVHVDVPIELAQHLDACRVELNFREGVFPIVVFRTYYKKFREDQKRQDEQKEFGSRWYTFKGINPTLAELAAYRYLYIS